MIIPQGVAIATVAAAEAGTAPSQAPVASALKRGGRTGRMAQAEDAGLVFAFRARTIATLTLAAAVLVLAPWPRSLVYVGFAGGFLLFGFIPFALRRHPWAKAIKLIFVPLDVMLITAAVLNIPAAEPCAST